MASCGRLINAGLSFGIKTRPEFVYNARLCANSPFRHSAAIRWVPDWGGPGPAFSSAHSLERRALSVAIVRLMTPPDGRNANLDIAAGEESRKAGRASRAN